MEQQYFMKMAQPATGWMNATPCGNGKMGALVYSNISTETILFNHEDLYLPVFEQPQIPKMKKYLPVYRDLLEKGKCHEADRYWREGLKKEGWGDFVYSNPQHPAFDLRIYQKYNAVFSGYTRELNMANGEAVTKWKIKNAEWERRVFVSRADDLAAIYMTCSVKGSVCADLEVRPHEFKEGRYPVKLTKEELPLAFCREVSGQLLRIEGRYTKESKLCKGGFAATVKVIPSGGEMFIQKEKIRVSGADSVLILVKLDKSKEPENVRHEFPEIGYSGLLNRHEKLHRELFLRSTLSLGTADYDVTNEELIYRAYHEEKVPALLLERLYYFGRYLLLSSSGAKLPPNLQGIWNGEYLPPWCSSYTLDENLQMMHWQVLPGNMWELMDPYFRFAEDSMPQWENNAREFYGCNGALAPISQGNHAGLAENMPYLTQTCMTGWIAADFYLYYLYSGDREFLEKRALPVMEKALAFYLDFAYENEDGELVICPSMSPENNPALLLEGQAPDPWLRAGVNPTIDVAVFKELLKNVSESYRILGIRKERREEYESLQKKLPSYQLDEAGAFREWLHEKYGEHYRHRHMSHLYPVYPGMEIQDQGDRKWFCGCRKALEKKMDHNMESMTCWGYVHMAHCWNRLDRPEKALECLEYAVKGCLGPNFFLYINDNRGMGIAESCRPGYTYDSPVFQMDSNAGISSLILQMLVDSYPDRIRVLFGLPDSISGQFEDWKTGYLENARCIGGTEISVKWNRIQKIVRVRLTAHKDHKFTLQFPDWIQKICIKENGIFGHSVELDMKESEVMELTATGDDCGTGQS